MPAVWKATARKWFATEPIAVPLQELLAGQGVTAAGAGNQLLAIGVGRHHLHSLPKKDLREAEKR
jgi:hypothetical protein